MWGGQKYIHIYIYIYMRFASYRTIPCHIISFIIQYAYFFLYFKLQLYHKILLDLCNLIVYIIQLSHWHWVNIMTDCCFSDNEVTLNDMVEFAGNKLYQNTTQDDPVHDVWDVWRLEFQSYRQTSIVRPPNPETSMPLFSSCNYLCAIHWTDVLSWEWRCSWSSADKRCSTTYEWSTMLLPSKMSLILDVWRYLKFIPAMLETSVTMRNSLDLLVEYSIRPGNSLTIDDRHLAE